MNEKEFLQKIKEDAESITPPASLHPDVIEQKLKQMQKNTTSIPESSIYRNIFRYGSLAAVFALAITVAFHSKKLQPEISPTIRESQSEMLMNAQESQPEISSNTQITSAEPEDKLANAPANLEAVYRALYEEFYYTEEEFYPGLGARLYGTTDSIEYDMEEIAVEEYAVTESQMNSSASDDGATADSSTADSVDFSDTNVQEQGVDEADIVKTDGQYIYILREDLSLAIVEANSGTPELVSITELPQKYNGAIHEMYLDGDALYVILTETVTELNNEEDVYYTQTTRRTSLLTYSIADRAEPVLSGQVTQDGAYSDSRKNGQYIYLFTRYTPDICDTYEESTVAPQINGVTADASAFYLPENLNDINYLVISSVDTAAPDQVLDSKILVSGASNFYVSQNNIYIMNENYGGEYLTTELTRFHYEDGSITGASAGSVKGYLNNSFSLNEYDSCLRVVSTYTDESLEEKNGLFIFDENLNQISSIENLAEGETIRSARFLGDTGYFVTFRQTDPLFSVDLSNPANPQILGELKISGFSSYLHFYGEDLLLGIGYEADESTGQTAGIKLSMFDISDPANVTEIHRYTIQDITWCPSIEDYKSILVQPEKNLIGFYWDDRYLAFSYDQENGFTQELVYDFYSDGLNGQADYYNMRGLYIEDILYLAGNSFVISFDMENGFEKTNVLTID